MEILIPTVLEAIGSMNLREKSVMTENSMDKLDIVTIPVHEQEQEGSFVEMKSSTMDHQKQ